MYQLGVGTFLVCILLLMLGRRIERTLELLNWVMVVCILGGFLALGLYFVPGSTWAAAGVGFFGFDLPRGRFSFMPGEDYLLLAALAGYSGAGGMVNIALSSWARDKGYGMGQRAGYIPAAVGGHKVNLAHTGFIFTPTSENMRRWLGWWRIVSADQWGVFFLGAMLGMVLPAVLYVTLLPIGTNIQGLGMAAALASAVGTRSGAAAGAFVAMLAAWILFKTQLDIIESMVRSITDIVWTGSHRARTLSRGDVRVVYYGALALVCVWGMIALRLAQPIMLLMLAANIAGMVFTIASLHLLYLNTRLLPLELRPPLWRRVALVAHVVLLRVLYDPVDTSADLRNHEDTKSAKTRRNSNTEARAAVDVVGRVAANAREHANVKYKTLGSLVVLYFSSCVLAGAPTARRRRLPRSRLTQPTEKCISPCVSVPPCLRGEIAKHGRVETTNLATK